MSLREIISVTTVEEETSSEQLESDGSCKLMIQCLKDSHPTYFVVSSRSEMVSVTMGENESCVHLKNINRKIYSINFRFFCYI